MNKFDDIPPYLTPEAENDMRRWEASIRKLHGKQRVQAVIAFENRYRRPPLLFLTRATVPTKV